MSSIVGKFEIEKYVVTASLKDYFGDEEEVTIPEGVTDIANDVFKQRDRLRKVAIPEGFMFLGSRVFNWCINLESVTLPSTLKRIGSECFCHCASLKEIAIPDGVETIGPGAFCECFALQKVNLPAALRHLNPNVFAQCHELHSIFLPEGLEKIDEKAFFAAGDGDLTFTIAEGNKNFAVEKRKLIDVRTGKVLWAPPAPSADEDFQGNFGATPFKKYEKENTMAKNNLQDELKKLAEALGKIQQKENDEINMFTAFHLQSAERHHSSFFAGLLAPSNPHHLGDAPIRKFLYYLWDDTVREEKPSGTSRPIKTRPNSEILQSVAKNRQALIDLSQGDISVETEVHTNENGRGKRAGYIDILVKISAKDEETASSVVKTVIVIENKTGTETHSDQLCKYEDYIDAIYPDSKKIFVLISPLGNIPVNRGGDEQYNDRYCIFDYGNERGVCKILEELIDELDVPPMKTQMTPKQRRKIKMILEDYKDMVTNNLLHENPSVYALCEEIINEHKDALEAIDTYRNSATPKKVRQYCKDFFGATTAEDAQQFMTQKMEDAFAGEKHSNLKALFHIVLLNPSDGKGYQLKIELENSKNNGIWSPMQARIIQALETAGMVPLNHTDHTVTVDIPGKGKAMEILTVKERMEPFADVQPILDQRLTEFKKTVIALENVLATLTPASPAQP